MVMLGIDAQKATHTAVAVDDLGRQIGQRQVAATDAGHRQLLGWALRQWPGDGLRFAVEDCRQVSTRVERTLLLASQDRRRSERADQDGPTDHHHEGGRRSERARSGHREREQW